MCCLANRRCTLILKEYSTKEASNKLRCSVQFIRNQIRNKKLNANKIGNTWIIKESDLLSWIHDTHFIIEPKDHPRKSIKVPKRIALSFFTGAGGLDIGMAKAGIVPVLVNDCDKDVRKSIKLNYPNMALLGDINKITPDKIYKYARLPKGTKIDYMFGGPPCQSFSSAGKQRGFNDSRGNVFLQYLHLIGELKPRYAVIENVRGLLSIAAKLNIHGKIQKIHGGVLLYALKKLKSFGYSVSFDLYDAANFGAPEKRERVVIIAKLGNKKVGYLRPTNSNNPWFHLPKWRTFGEAIKGLPSSQHYIDYPKKRFKYLKDIPEGGNWRSLPVSLQKQALGHSYYLGGGKTGFLRRLSRKKPAPTLVTNPTMPATDLIHPTKDRPLSIEEYARVQGFPDTWHFAGKILDQYKQIGNAVPVPLGEAIGRCIINDEKGIDYYPPKIFKYSRYKHTDDKSWLEYTVRRNPGIRSLRDIPDNLN